MGCFFFKEIKGVIFYGNAKRLYIRQYFNTNTAGSYVIGNSNDVADTTIKIDTVNPSYGVCIWLRTA